MKIKKLIEKDKKRLKKTEKEKIKVQKYKVILKKKKTYLVQDILFEKDMPSVVDSKLAKYLRTTGLFRVEGIK